MSSTFIGSKFEWLMETRAGLAVDEKTSMSVVRPWKTESRTSTLAGAPLVVARAPKPALELTPVPITVT